MVTFIDDPDMDAQLQRTLSATYSGSADIGEAIAAAGRVTPGDYDSWWEEWSALGELSDATAAAAEAGGNLVSAAKARLRATEYWRQAWFFLRHDLDDPRLQEGWRRHQASFAAATALLPSTFDRVTLPFEGARMEGWFVRPDASGRRRPTIVAPCGYDSTAEAGWAATGYMALARGYNFYVVEGPGQGGMLYEQRVPMRRDFEVPFAVMLDDLLERPGVDQGAVVLMGRSFAGYLAPRAAAFDRRIAALVCDPGQVEFTSRIVKWTGVPVAQMGAESGTHPVDDDPKMAEIIRGLIDGPRNTEYWGARMATHQITDVATFFRELARYDITGVAPDIRCPTLITEGEGDFASQGAQLRDLLTCPSTSVSFPAASGAAGHCEGLGATLFEQVAFDWIDGVLSAS